MAKKSIYVVTVVGARPQFIKAAALSRAIARHNASSPEPRIIEKIIHTGQHYDDNMSKVFFDELEIPRPDYNLCVGSGLHGEQTGQMLRLVEDVFVKERPDMALVYGDTNSTLAGALAATKLHIPVLHVEAGLRSFNRKMPEEINRSLTDHISKLLFCPTKTAVDNLVAEGIRQGVYEIGDVMYDSVVFYLEKARSIESAVMEAFSIQKKSYYLATIHRPENTGDAQRLDNILKGLGEISSAEHPTVLPLHPRTKKTIAELGLTTPENIRIVEPVSYLQMIALENNAKSILTDSGGIQKEAYMLGVPCITLRNETEWIETVESGWNVLAGPDRAEIIEAVKQADELRRAKREPFYGDGLASDKICDIIGRGVQ